MACSCNYRGTVTEIKNLLVSLQVGNNVLMNCAKTETCTVQKLSIIILYDIRTSAFH